MSNVGMDKHGRVDNVKMTLPCKGEYVGVARLTLSAIANRMGFNIEEIEDIKVAVAEGCTNAIKHGLDEKFHLDIEVFEDRLKICIQDSGKGGLGIFIIKTLMDEVELYSKIGEGSQIKMVKYLGDGR